MEKVGTVFMAVLLGGLVACVLALMALGVVALWGWAL